MDLFRVAVVQAGSVPFDRERSTMKALDLTGQFTQRFPSDHDRTFGDLLLNSVGHYEGSTRIGVGRGRLDIPWQKRNFKVFLSD